MTVRCIILSTFLLVLAVPCQGNLGGNEFANKPEVEITVRPTYLFDHVV